MKQEKKHLPLFQQVLLWVMLGCFTMLAVTLGVTLHYSLETAQTKTEEVLMSTVATLSHTPTVKEILQTGEGNPTFFAYLNDVVRNTNVLNYITIAGTDSIRLYHIDPDYIGLPFEGGDQHRALAGESYLSETETENFGEQLRAFHPVFDEEGAVIGFVLAAATHEQLGQIRASVYWTYLRLALLMTVVILVFNGVLAVYLGKQLRGVKPEDLIRVYLTQNDILNALDEGMVSYDNEGRVRLVNAAAARMLGHREDLLLGRQVDELIRAENGESLRDRKPDSIRSSRPDVLVRPVQLPDSNLWARQVLILTDRSEATRYAEDLVGTRHMLNALRATNHEFVNKLQVISGLLQMGRVSQAQAYIGALSSNYAHIIGPVMRQIRNANVAALILGKENNMRELDIRLNLLGNSRLPEHSRYLQTGELVTVVGNLLENAMEAVNAVPSGGMRAVDLQITEDENGLLVMVSDTGVGIREEDLPHVFENGFSTKARTGRGIGMKLIQDIVDRQFGSIDVDTEPGSGTTISVIFGRERGELQ